MTDSNIYKRNYVFTLVVSYLIHEIELYETAFHIQAYVALFFHKKLAHYNVDTV